MLACLTPTGLLVENAPGILWGDLFAAKARGAEAIIFLIEYNRPEGRIVTFKRFKNSERLKAEESRLDLELDLNRRRVDHEVVLLEAANEAALRRTHRRYFETARQIAESATGGGR